MTITTAIRLAGGIDPTATTGRLVASLAPRSWNAADRTVDVVWTTGATVRLLDPFSGDQIDETLRIGTGNVRLGRLNAGAPVLDHHNALSLGGQIGVVVPGSARMVAGGGVAKLRLSDRPDLAPIVADIASGIIRNVSVGYCRHAKTVVERPNASTLWDVTDWEPTEISFVTVPADAGASVRSHPSTALRPPQETYMADETTTTTTTAPATPDSGTRGQGGNRAHVPATIRELRAYANALDGSMTPEQASHLCMEYAERGLSMDEVRSATMQIMGERQRMATSGITTGGRAIAGSGTSIGGRFVSDMARQLSGGNDTFANPTFHGDAIRDALYARMSGTAPTDAARQFMGMSLVQMAGEMLEQRGVSTRGMAPNDVVEAASWNRVGARANFAAGDLSGPGHSTSDFPDLLMNSGQRFLMDVFTAAASPLKQIGRKRSVGDFRAVTGIQLSGFGVLPKVLEGGELKHGSFRERSESYRVESFGKIFGLTRQAIINDELGAFTDPTITMARAAAETEAQILADLIMSNPVMRDGYALFSAEHGNLAPAGAAPSFAALDQARLAMREQKDLDGVTPLATAPKFIVSGPRCETAIEQLVAGVINPTEIGGVNPFAGKLTPLVDPRLPGYGWQLFADPYLTPVIEYAYLNGNEGPQMDTRDGWSTLGTEFRVYMDFGAGIIDARGAYKNPGAAPA